MKIGTMRCAFRVASRLAPLAGAFALIVVAMAPGAAFAGGLFLYEIGTPDVGLASAGYAARAQDAATVFTNPAGMTRLDDSQLLAGVQPIYGHQVFHPNNKNTTSGTDGGNAIIPLPGASGFYVHSLTPDIKLGIGTCTYFGGALEYNKNWVGRYFLQGATILGTSILPTVAYKVNEWLSVGAGFNIMIGYLKERVAINNLDPSLPDGQMSIKDWTAGIGGDIGVMVEPDSRTRFGIQYLTPVSLSFSDVPHFSGLGPTVVGAFRQHGIFGAPLTIDLTVPQALVFSAFHQLNDKFAIMGDAGWQDWSAFGDPQIGINSSNPKSATANLRYQDTFHLAAGTQYKPSRRLTWNAGFAFDNSMVSGPSRSVAAPVGDQYRFGAGAQYALTEALTAGAAYEFMWQGDLGLQQGTEPVRGTVAGRFRNVNISFFSFNLVWKFGTVAH
ncbi:MAG TPA: outer membrane protein transport protein [Candidatus Acidoferrales bacterium]|nr:outer membrane protein transport protein [Candidatus Acidoferrales bacterium]